MTHWKPWLLALLVAAGGIASISAPATPARAQETPAAIDWDKARQLFQKERRGEALTADEKAYLDQAKAARAAGQRPGAAATRPVEPARASTGLIPLPDMPPDAQYKGQDGGLYGGGRNDLPPEHKKTVQAAVAKIEPLDAEGQPAATGKIVLLSMGMSNTTQEFSRFKALADANAARNPKLVIVDGAQGGQDAAAWIDPQRGPRVWETAEQRMKAAGVTPKQVQVVWLKQALIQQGRHGEFPKHADVLRDDVIKNLQAAREHCPNLQVAYLSSRIYAGYAKTALNPEPYAYEGAFAMRAVIQAQIKGEAGMGVADGKVPAVLWGPYLWTDGTKGRQLDDLVWKAEDVGADGTHPSATGQQKVADMLLRFFQTDETAKGWFTGK